MTDKTYATTHNPLYFLIGEPNMTDTGTTYNDFKPVNTRNPKNYEIMNLTIPSNDSLVVRYEEDKDMKFNFTDGSRILVFYWINVLSLRSSKHQKRTEYNKNENKIKNLQDKCENYPSDDDDLYSKENQIKSLKDIPVPSSFNNSNADMECGHPYGCLDKYQIIPLWFFELKLARLASCSYMNVVPVWRSIVKQLRKVDLYIVAALQYLHAEVTFGVSGALKIPSPSSPTTGITRKQQKMYLRASESKNKKVAIPRIMYRIIKRISSLLDQDETEYNAVIIIHNDPTADPKVDMLCINDTLSGWDRITNDDPRTGLAYVCPLTEKINEELGAFDNLTLSDIERLELDLVPYYRGYTYPVSYEDDTYDINKYFDDNLIKRFGL